MVTMRKSQRIWGVVAKVVGEAVATIKGFVMMYKAVVQVVLLYRSKIWVVDDSIITLIQVFHHSIDRCIAEMTARKLDGR